MRKLDARTWRLRWSWQLEISVEEGGLLIFGVHRRVDHICTVTEYLTARGRQLGRHPVINNSTTEQ